MRVSNGLPPMVRLLMLFIALALLNGCATHRAMPVAPAPAPSAYEPTTATPSGLTGFRLTRSFAGPDTVLEPVPTAMLLLDEGSKVNARICDAFLRIPPTVAVLAQSLVDPNLIVTRMPLTTQAPDATRLGDCAYVLSIYDFKRARTWKAQLGIATSAAVFVVLFPSGDAGATPFLALDTSTLGEAELDGVVAKWQSALALASTELQPPVQAPAAGVGAPGSSACDTVGETVRVVSPVLIAMGAAALIAEYPAVGLVIGTFTAKDPNGSVVKHFQKSISSLSDYLGTLATKGCNGLLNAIRTRIFGNKGGASTP